MARILAVSDMHGRRSAVDSIRNLVAEHSPDLLVICGDITDFGRIEWEGGLLDFIGIPVMAVDGNCDAPRVAQALALSGHVHESRGICQLGDTVCVNPGPVMEGFGAVVDVAEGTDARLVQTTGKRSVFRSLLLG